MFISLILIGLSLYILWKGEVGISATRKLSARNGRIIGILMVITSVLQYMFIDGPWVIYGPLWGFVTIVVFLGVLVFAFFIAEKTPTKVVEAPKMKEDDKKDEEK
ncbi:MAG: hypothetical protein PHQ40_06645 [Anaerolineaceae bacterium]|nr:hypothetical protein [Anaerolineaceae bacterium]